jgi:hypothetical protein
MHCTFPRNPRARQPEDAGRPDNLWKPVPPSHLIDAPDSASMNSATGN